MSIRWCNCLFIAIKTSQQRLPDRKETTHNQLQTCAKTAQQVVQAGASVSQRAGSTCTEQG